MLPLTKARPLPALYLPAFAAGLAAVTPSRAQLITDSSLVLRYDASDLNGDGVRDAAPSGLVRVDQWNDTSASASHAVRSGTNGNVFLFPSTLHGQPTVHFGTTHLGGTAGIDRLESGTMTAEQITGPNRDEISIFLVTRRHANVVHFQWQTGSGNRVGFEGASRWDFVNDQNVATTGGQLLANFAHRGEPYIYGAVRTPASAAVAPRTQTQFFDGAADFNTRQHSLTLTAGTASQWGIGVQTVAQGGGNPSHVDFGDIAVYKRALSAAERVQVENYFKKKYFMDTASLNGGVYVNRATTQVHANFGAVWGVSSVASTTNLTGTLVGVATAAENIDKAFDNYDQTKYLMPGSTGSTAAPTPAAPYYVYARTAGDVPFTVNTYDIVSANDDATRDLKDWVLEGSNNGTAWTAVDTVTGELFASRFLKKSFTCDAPGAYSWYRLKITANNGNVTTTASIQFADLLFNSNPVYTSSSVPTNVAERVWAAFDGRTDTKFLTTATNPSGWVQTQLPSAEIIRSYIVSTANDVPGRDPRTWTVEGSNDGTNWSVLDTQTDVAWQARYQVKEFNFSNSTAYTYYRYNVSKNWGDPQLQFSEFQIFNYSATTDSDGDGAADAREFQEFANLTTLAAGDADGDGLTNGWEFTHFAAISSPADGTGDADGDGRTDAQEFADGSNPKMPDTDGDGRTDGQEFAAGTSPTSRDTDNDGLTDAQEATAGTNPVAADSDADGADDSLEVAIGTNPNLNTSKAAAFDSISINFAENDIDLIAPGELIGPYGYLARNWNNVAGRSSAAPYSSNLTSVKSHSGATVPVTVDWVSPGTFRFNNTDFINYNTAIKRLLNGYLDDSTTDGLQSVTFTGIPYSRYHVIVFTEGDNAANGNSGSYRILDNTGTTTLAAKRYLQNSGGLDTSIILTEGTAATTGLPFGNALIFKDLTASGIRIQGLRESTPIATRSPIGAIMIVPFDPAADTDGDTIPDEKEIVAYQSLDNGPASDTDGDGLNFAAEIAAGTNPANRDTDNDGLADGAEVTAGTSPLLADTDGDGLSDLTETQIGTNGTLTDSDTDTFVDGLEIALGSNPASAASTPPSDLLFYEGFNNVLYGVGRFDTQAASALYSPRTFTVVNATAAARLEQGSLRYGNLATSGNVLRTPPGPVSVSSESFGNLDLAGRFAPLVNGGFVGGGTVSGTVYVSFLFKSNRVSRDWLGNIISGTYTEPAPSSRAVAVSFAGFQFYRNTTEVIGLGETSGSTNYSGFFPNAGGVDMDFTPAVRLNNQTRLMVAKITFNASANDDIKVWLDPNLSLPEAGQTGSTITRTGNGDCSFNRIAWRSGGNTSNDGSVDYDEVRFGTTWASVVPTVNDPATTGVVINEFAASNPGTIRDEDGSSSDWIELFNGSAAPVTLDGMYLTDATALNTKWQFPDTTPDRVLAPGQYLIVWASNKDAAKRPFYTSTSELHTNFALSTNSPAPTLDVLRLVAADGTTVVSSFTEPYPQQTSVATYGRSGASEGFMQATPGTANGTVYSSTPSVLTISPASSVRTAATTVTIAGQAASQQVRYTLDGSTPSISNGFTYTGPFSVAGSAQVRARVSQPGLDGPLASNIYMFYTATAQNNPINTYHLPILVIDTHNRTIPVDGSADTNEWPVDCSYTLYDTPATGVDLRATTPVFLTRGQIGLRGKSTSGETKRPFNVEFWRDDRNDDNAREVLGMGNDSDWVLNNLYTYDRGGLRNSTMFTLAKQMDHLAMDYRFVEVYLNQDGGDIQSADYYGLFMLTEKPNRAPDRVDVEALQADQNTAPDVTGGYILQLNKSYNAPASDYHLGIAKGVGVASATLGSFNFGITSSAVGNNTSDFLLEYPEEDRVTTPQADYITGYLNEMEDCLAPAAVNYTNPATSKTFTDYVDMPSWIDHHMLDTFPNNVDGLRLSFRLFKPRNGKLFAGPVWDFDRSMNSVDARDDNPNQWHATTGGYGTQFFIYGYFSRIFANPDYMMMWVDRWTDQRRSGAFTDANMQAVVNDNAAIVSPASLPTANAAIRNQAKWTGVPYTSNSLNAERDLIKNWMIAKAAFIDGQILRYPQFNVNGGAITTATSLTLTSSDLTGVAKIYYTTDGSDPRLPGGNVSPAATEYTGAFTLPAGHRPVKTRLFKSDAPNFDSTLNTTKMSKWSGLNEAYFFTDAVPAAAGNLVVSELMYHPADPSAAEITAGFTDADQFEYIELLNIGATAIDLFESRFTSGIDYHFRNGTITQLAPGERLLIVKNLAAFTFRNGAAAAARVAGVIEGNDNFNNNGETVTIVDRLGAVILSFSYDDEAPWPADADGLGRSLVLILPETNPNPNAVANWRSSVVSGGEPGSADSRTYTGTATQDNDNDGLTGLVEHANGTNDNDALSIARPVASLITAGASQYQALTIIRDRRADGIVLTPQRSTDLAAWSTGAGQTVDVSTTDNGNGTDTVVFRSAVPWNADLREYLRILVTKP